MMDDSVYSNAGLVKYQRLVWYLSLAYFSIVCVLLIMKVPVADFLSHLGVKIVLLATVSQLVVIARQFRQAGNRRFMIWSYVLLLVIAVSSATGSFLL